MKNKMCKDVWSINIKYWLITCTVYFVLLDEFLKTQFNQMCSRKRRTAELAQSVTPALRSDWTRTQIIYPNKPKAERNRQDTFIWGESCWEAPGSECRTTREPRCPRRLPKSQTHATRKSQLLLPAPNEEKWAIIDVCCSPRSSRLRRDR